jgi:hypothetical protein
MKHVWVLGVYIFGVAQFCQEKSPLFRYTVSFSITMPGVFCSHRRDRLSALANARQGAKLDLTNVVIYDIFRASFDRRAEYIWSKNLKLIRRRQISTSQPMSNGEFPYCREAMIHSAMSPRNYNWSNRILRAQSAPENATSPTFRRI